MISLLDAILNLYPNQKDKILKLFTAYIKEYNYVPIVQMKNVELLIHK